MGRVVNDESGDDEEQVDAAAAAGENERHDAFGDLVPFRRNAPGVKGNHREGRNESEDLDVGKHWLHWRPMAAPSDVSSEVTVLRTKCSRRLEQTCACTSAGWTSVSEGSRSGLNDRR